MVECPSSIFFWHVYFVIVPFFCRFCFISLCFFCVLSLELCGCSSDFFSVQQTTYRTGNHVYYWVRLRPDQDGVYVPVRELLCCFPVVLQVLACAVRWVSGELSRCFLGSVLQIGSQMFP